MNKQQASKRMMYAAVSVNFKDNKTIWEGLPYFASNVATFLGLIDSIDKTLLIQTRDYTGSAEDKNDRRIKLEESAVVVVYIVQSYASFTNNKVLEDEIHYTASMLKTCTGNDLIVNSGAIHKIAKANLTGAGQFGLTQGFLDDLMAKKLEFEGRINDPANRLILKKNATADLKKLFSAVDKLLKKNIDRDMIIFKIDSSTFYQVHFGCREIHKAPKTKLAMRIKIVDAVTKEPIPKALVAIKDHEIKRKSSPLGAMRILHLKEGIHTVTVSMDGYITQAVKTKHTAGETTVLEVKLVVDK